jgi:hypothetical protein
VNATTGAVLDSGHLDTKTFEIQVMDGFSFSQNTNTETITVSEAGATPTRGQRSFNTSLAPVEFSFSTYIRPYKSTNVKAEEGPLWGALTSFTGNGWTEAVGDATISVANSNANKLQPFGLVFVVDQVTYVIDNCVMNEATIDFGIDAIAMIAWSGSGATLRKLGTSITTPTAGTFTGTLVGTYKQKTTTPIFLANKLSTATIGNGGATYTVPLTGGSLTYSNNVTYLTPENLGTVNQPITYFTGTRSISGTVNAYLKTGAATDTGALLSAMLSDTNNVAPNYQVKITIGGINTATTRVDLDMPTCSLTIPSVDVQQIVSTSINFTAQGSTTGLLGGTFDIGSANELTGKYYAA